MIDEFDKLDELNNEFKKLDEMKDELPKLDELNFKFVTCKLDQLKEKSDNYKYLLSLVLQRQN